MLTLNKNCILVILSIVLLSSVCFCQLPHTQAASAENTEATELQTNTLSLLSDVIDLDTANYAVSVVQASDDLYKETLQRENIRVTLDSDDSTIDLLYTYINGKITKIYVCSNEGVPCLNTESTSDLTLAQNFLAKYEVTTGDSFYGQLNSVLETVDASRNSSIIVGNIELTITVLEKDTTFQWTYITNGIEAPDKTVSLEFTDGFLNCFIDNWDLYNIGSTDFRVTEADAINIAMATAEIYSPDSSVGGTIGGLKFNVTNAMVVGTYLSSAVYVGADAARSDDFLELYPMYSVWVSLDKFYSGNIYGFNVYIWADTGEVYYINERTSTIDPPSELMASYTDSAELSENTTTTTTPLASLSSSVTSFIGPIALLSFIIVGFMMRYFVNRRDASQLSLYLPAIRRLKFGRILPGFLLLSLLLISMIPLSVATYGNQGAAVIWGSESTGAYNSTLGQSWRKTSDEVANQQNVSSYIDWLFDNNGYTSYNNQGSNNSGSEHDAIIDKIDYLESTNNPYSQYAVVDFDHGVGLTLDGTFHYMFEDNTGTAVGGTCPGSNDSTNAVYDYEVYESTSEEKPFFIFINTCLSADYNNAHGAIEGTDNYPSYTQGPLPDGTARGMAYAWTHREVGAGLSSDGYTLPDTGSQCYIGFDYGSAALDQSLTSSDYPYYYWVYHFFYYAIACDYTVHAALDLASQDAFYGSPTFSNSPLANTAGFSAVWPTFVDPTWDTSGIANCHMRVYGNSYIKLHQQSISLSAVDASSNSLSTSFTIGSETESDSHCWLISDTYTVTAADIPNYDFSYFTYNGQTYNSNGASIPLTSDGTLVAHYVWNPVYYYLNVASTGSGGTVSPSGNTPYLSYSSVPVTATPNAGYINYWTSTTLSGYPDWSSSSTKTVLMNASHTLTANFIVKPYYNFVQHYESTSGASGLVTNPSYIAGPYCDGQYTTVSGYGPYLSYGTIITHLYDTTSGHVYVYGYTSYSSGALYVYTSTDGSSWSLLGTPTVSNTSPAWIDCGYTTSTFSYIMFAAADPSNIFTVQLDSVHVDYKYFDLTVTTSGTGTTSITSGSYLNGTYASVTATAGTDYVFSYWTKNGTVVSTNPTISVYMDNNYALQAVFTSTAPTYVSSVTSSGGSVYNPSNIVGSSNDGNYATLEGWGPYQYYGYVCGAMNSASTGTIYVYAYDSYGSGPLYVYTSNDGSSWSLFGTTFITNGSPAWIDCGTTASQFSYIMLTTEDTGYIYTICVDAVKVQP